MKKIFLPLGLLALIAAPSAGSAKLVLDMPPILAGSNSCEQYGCPKGASCYPACLTDQCNPACCNNCNPCDPACKRPCNTCSSCCGTTCINDTDCKYCCNNGSCSAESCPSGPTGILNDTGIVTPTGGGQDADFGRDFTHNNNADGAAGFSFTSINSTCVLDNVTGLAWEVKTAANTGLKYDWAGAKAYAEGTAAEKFTGCGDTYTCRLPTVKELLGIVHFGNAAAPFIDPTFFPNTASATYLSGTEVANASLSSSTQVWGVDFSWGITDNAIGKTSGGYRARAVCVPKP